MKAPMRYLLGFTRVEVMPRADGYAWILNLLHTENIPFWSWKGREGCATFCLLRRDARRLSTFAACQDGVRVLSEWGLLPWLGRYRYRFGLAAGMLALCATVLASGRFLWDVRVEGNESVPDAEIVAQLQALGCGVGTYIPDLDCYRVCKEYLMADGRIAWISVNVVGNVAHVRVREEVTAPPKEDDAPANLVAAEDGVVVYTTLSAGQSMIGAGDAVRAGELLVSGLVENKNGTYTLCRAEGSVFARVGRILSAEVPLLQTQTERAEAVYHEKSVLFFGKELNFFKKDGFFSENSGNLGAKYDTIKEERYLTLFGRIVLPIKVTDTTVYRTEEVVHTRTEEDARAQARAQLEAALADLGAQAQILAQSEVQLTQTDTGVRALCRVECIVDIAQKQTIGIVTP